MGRNMKGGRLFGCLKEGGGLRTPYKKWKINILLLQKNKAKEIGCKKITKIKRGVGYRRKDVV